VQDVFPNVDALIPHRDAMRLIERVVAASDQAITVESRIQPSSPFMIEGHGVPSYVGLELMAQSICAFDGLQRFEAGEQPAIGFLLGCRKYTAHQSLLPLRERLQITAVLNFSDGEMAVFDCRIETQQDVCLAE